MIDSTNTLIVSHRGDTLQAPENTIESSQYALSQGASGLEVDVRMCATGELVLFHDKTLIRHFNRYRPICLTPWQELKRLRYAHPNFSNELGIVLLNDFLEQFKGTVPLILDIKTLCGRHIKIVKSLIRILEKFEMQDQIWVSAFDPLILKILKKLRPNIRTGFLFNRFSRLYQSLDMMLHSDAWHPHHHLVSDALVEKARKLQKQIYVCTINDIATLQRLSKYKFEGIITDTLFRREYNLNKLL